MNPALWQVLPVDGSGTIIYIEITSNLQYVGDISRFRKLCLIIKNLKQMHNYILTIDLLQEQHFHIYFVVITDFLFEYLLSLVSKLIFEVRNTSLFYALRI